MRGACSLATSLALAMVLGLPAAGAFSVNAKEPPTFGVFPSFVSAFGWPAGVDLKLTADDPTTGVAPDISVTLTTDAEGFAERVGVLPGLQPGWRITVTDGVTTKKHTVLDISITDVDPATEIVRGTADPGTEVWVSTMDLPDGEGVYARAGASATWRAEFSGLYDIEVGSFFHAWQKDEDGDFTLVERTAQAAPKPLDVQNLKGGIEGKVTDGTYPVADIIVKAEASTSGGRVLSSTTRTGSDGAYRLGRLAPGAYRVTFVDPEGRFPPEVYDNVDVAPGATTGGIDAAIDLPGPAVSGFPAPAAPEPLIVLDTVGGILGQGWPAATAVGVTLDDPATPRSPDLRLSAVTDADGAFTLEAGAIIVAGFVATAADSMHLKTHTVTEVRIATVDAEGDTVHGIAAPGSTIVVTVRTGEAVEPERQATAGVDGTWIANFSVPAGTQPRDVAHDIVVGERVSARQSDADGDITQDNQVAAAIEEEPAAPSGDGFREPGPLVPTITTYIPTPRDISTDPPVVGANLLLAALAMIVLTVATELLNRSLGQLDPILRRRFRPIDQLDRRRARLDAALIGRLSGQGRARRADALRILGIAAFYGVVFALLDPTWNPLSVTGLWLVLIMGVAFGLIGLIGDIAAWATARRWGIAGDLAVRPGSLVTAVGSTLFSRVLVLVPGVMIGSPEALEIDAMLLDRRRLSRLAGVGLGTVLAVGLLAWLATLGTTALRGGGQVVDNLVGGAEAFFLLVFAAAVQNGFVQLLSLRESAGLALRRAHRIPWAVALVAVTFAFWHTLVNPRGDLAEALDSTNVQAFLATVGIVLLVALIVWAASAAARRRAARGEPATGGATLAIDTLSAPAMPSAPALEPAPPEAPLPEAPAPL